MIKKSKKLYIILLCISIIGLLFTAIYTLLTPEMLDGYGKYTTLIMALIFGYHVYFYIKEIRNFDKTEDNNSSNTKK